LSKVVSEYRIESSMEQIKANTLSIMKLVVLTFILFSVPALAKLDGQMSLPEFKALAEELAPKVNLFQDIWSADPSAEFFGGTSRDFLYWLKGKLKNASGEGTLKEIISKLRTRQIIDVREFILYESDVDVVSTKPIPVDAATYGVKKIDTISPDRFDVKTESGQNEIKQGYIPVEKIRLGLNGFIRSDSFGNGLREIYESKPTVHFSSDSDFRSTHYAQLGINHPILLALRYIRILAMNYFQNFGAGLPKSVDLLSGIDSQSEVKTKNVINQALGDSNFQSYLSNEKFAKWLNSTIQKTFRSYTNPTAAKLLMQYFKADLLVETFKGIEPINQYLFATTPKPQIWEENFKKYKVKESELFVPRDQLFPDGHLYHGTKTESAFRSILFQGILPSEEGVAGPGLYGVSSKDVAFASEWAGDASRVVMFDVSPTARIVDLRQPEAYQLAENFSSREAFAEAFGIDIFLYPYKPDAYVVKNGSVLASVTGYKRKLLKIPEMIQVLRQGQQVSIEDFLNMVFDNALSLREIEIVSKEPMANHIFQTVAKLPVNDLLVLPEIQKQLDGGRDVFRIPALRNILKKHLESEKNKVTLDDFAHEEAFNKFDIQLKKLNTSLLNERYAAIRKEILIERSHELLASFTDAQLLKWIDYRFKAEQVNGLNVGLIELQRRKGNSQAQQQLEDNFWSRKGDVRFIVNIPMSGISSTMLREWYQQEANTVHTGTHILQLILHQPDYDSKDNRDFLKGLTHEKDNFRRLLAAFFEYDQYGKKTLMISQNEESWDVFSKMLEVDFVEDNLDNLSHLTSEDLVFISEGSTKWSHRALVNLRDYIYKKCQEEIDSPTRKWYISTYTGYRDKALEFVQKNMWEFRTSVRSRSRVKG
jgi:hypothetical protein